MLNKSKAHIYGNWAIGFFNYGLSWLREQIYKITKAEYVRSRYGVLLKSNWQDITFRMAYYALYQFHLSRFLTKINTPFIFLDIGANQGIFSLAAGKNLHCKKVLAFEPVSDIYNILKKNIAINKLEKTVIPHKVAISNKFGQGNHYDISALRGYKYNSD